MAEKDAGAKTASNDILSLAIAELNKERVSETTGRLKEILDRERKAKKILRNIQREKEDFLAEIKQDEEDTNSLLD